MDSVFKYSLLHYVHSQFLAERLNIGILFYFPFEKRLVFRKLDRLDKLQALYPTFPKTRIEAYLDAFHDVATDLSNNSKDFDEVDDLTKLADKYFIIRESAPLQFSEAKTALLYGTISDVVQDYKRLYEENLSGIDGQAIESFTFSYKSTLQQLRNTLQSRIPEYESHLLPIRLVKNDKVVFKPDLIWKNGTTNLVKEIVFSESEEAILDAALLTSLKLNNLRAESEKNGYRFDLLIQPPKKNELIQSYQEALDILNNIESNKRIITADTLQNYLDEMIKDFNVHS